MKCENCPANYFQNYEDGEPDFYCKIGITDNSIVEYKDLSIGCRTPYNKIMSLLRGKEDWGVSEPEETGEMPTTDNTLYNVNDYNDGIVDPTYVNGIIDCSDLDIYP